MSTKRKMKKIAIFFHRPVYLLALVFLSFEMRVCPMFGIDMNELRGRQQQRAAGEGIRSKQAPSVVAGAAFLSPDVIQSFNSAIKQFNDIRVKELVQKNPGLIASSQVEALKKSVELRTDNADSREKQLNIFRFLISQTDNPNVGSLSGMNALDVATGRLKMARDENDEGSISFYQIVGKELVEKGAVLKKRAGDQEYESIVQQLKPGFVVQEEPKNIEPVVPVVQAGEEALPQDPQKLQHPTLRRPIRVKNHPVRGARPSSDATSLPGIIDVPESAQVQESIPAALPATLPSDAILPSENPIPSVESIAEVEAVPVLPLPSISLDNSSLEPIQSVSPDNLPSVSEPVDFGTQEPLPLPSLPAPVTVPVSSVQSEVSLPPVVDSVSLPPVAEFESVSPDLESTSMPMSSEPLPLPLAQDPLPLPLAQESLPLSSVQEQQPLPLAQEPLPLPPVVDSVLLPPASDVVELPPVAEFESSSTLSEPVDFGAASSIPSETPLALFDQASLPLPEFKSEIPPQQELPKGNNFYGNFYEILGVSSSASTADVKKAYHKLSLKYHPDKNPDRVEEATEFFKKIQEAYATLGDNEKRAEYDVSQNIAQPAESFGPDYKMSDLRDAVKNLDYSKSVEILERSSLLFESEAEALKILLKLVTPKDETSKTTLLNIFKYALAQPEIEVNLRSLFTDRPETALDVAFDRLEKHFAEGDSYAAAFFEEVIKLLVAQGATLIRFASDQRAQQVVEELQSRPAYSVQQLEEFFQERKISQWKNFKAHKSEVVKMAQLQQVRQELTRELGNCNNELEQERQALNLLENKRQSLISVRDNTQKEIEQTRHLIENLKTNVRTNQ